MTEHEFDRMIDQAAGRFERAVEHAAGQFERAMEAGANHLDRSLTAAWDGSNLFRWSVCGATAIRRCPSSPGGRIQTRSGRSRSCCFGSGSWRTAMF